MGTERRRKGSTPSSTEAAAEQFADLTSSPTKTSRSPLAGTSGPIGEASVDKKSEDGKAVLVHSENPLVRRTIERILERVPDLVEARRAELAEQDIEALVNVYLADSPVADAERAIAADNARARAQFLQTVPCLTSADVHQASGNTAGNASITASRWKSAGRIFSVPHAKRDLFPAFQFRDGQPHPTVAKALAALPKDMSPWQIAFWFVSGNGWLDGAAPADALDREDEVVAVARREGEPVIG